MISFINFRHSFDIRRGLHIGSSLVVVAGLTACPSDGPGSDTGESNGIDTANATGSTGVATTTATSGGTGADGTGTTCEESCDGVCIDEVCCDVQQACGEVCCDGGQVCSFQQCVTPGEACVDASECPEGNYCEYSLGEPGMQGDGMCQGGVSLATGRCLPEPPECPAGVEPAEGDEIDCLPLCEIIPETSFAPEVKYHWTGGDSMMAPVVIQLDDDNCDEIIDERDIPEIVFTTFENGVYQENGTLHAISIVDGEIVEKWTAHPELNRINPGLSLAAGNIDGEPGNEIVACTDTDRVRAFRADGSELWTSPVTTGSCLMPSIANLDQAGPAEIIVEENVLSGVDGTILATFPFQRTVIAADLDADGDLDIVGPHTAYEADGSELASTGLTGSFPAVADFDGDGRPEVAAIDNVDHTLDLWRLNAAGDVQIIRQGININGSLEACPGDSGGGPPTIADFNGDGTPDVGVAAGVGYAVFDGAALLNPAVTPANTLLWITPAQDCSSRRTGSSVFDFDGNGSAEVVYADEQYLRIYNGVTGEVVFETCNTNGTLEEYPVIADVDNDGHADIVAVSNSYHVIACEDSQQQGLRVFGDELGLWVRTRRVWNQHLYHVTNVEEDGTIPLVELPNWTVPRLNNFRQNVQPQGEFAAPDLVVSIFKQCLPGEHAAVARVRNLGRAAVPQGVLVGFYAGDPEMGGTLLGIMVTTKVLYPAEAEELIFDLAVAPAGIINGEIELWVVVDDGMPTHPWQECRTNNNRNSALVGC